MLALRFAAFLSVLFRNYFACSGQVRDLAAPSRTGLEQRLNRYHNFFVQSRPKLLSEQHIATTRE